MNTAAQPAPEWIGEDAPVAATAPATPAATPVTIETIAVQPAAPAVVNPYSPRTVQYEIHRLQNLPAPAPGLDGDERDELIARRDELAERLLSTQDAIMALDAGSLPDDIDAAIAEVAERDVERVRLEKALALIAARLTPVQNALAAEQARDDQLAANADLLRKLTIVGAHLSTVENAVGALTAAANNLRQASSIGVPRGELAGIGGLPSVHFHLNDLVAKAGMALALLGHVR